ncbi:hypothetical protein QR90_06440 [Deinococcus radiopugnans]|uniref:Uncharacterized protein n=2 Tax=Deinococcus radiopugnans TaxID=57497 RepID=A0A0A7KF74_9DEIO|nr:hypothetical protein [Deinococcus radiopugnans]AIZ44812.1 hypothetical protein QR90_06440 [Deinococcus radiopugnans]MBB6016642.1 hypothetical protein [Deinococcus radiopugnans ATCC 19172]QLG11066.1 hypothetical protein HLB42_09960 [Deinococcus sp. D7000]TNM70760.1 hypothetical protein FHR04_11340 [Deinococcus radiopugnans ATCC 19172]
MTLNRDINSHRLGWRGVLAGIVVGLVSTLTIIALGLVITALTGLTLSGVGIAAAIWTGIAALVGAYLAGLTAVRSNAPSTRADDGIAAMTHDDATLTGLVTGSVLILLTTLFAFNSASRIVGTATSTLGGLVGTAATATTAAGVGGAQVPGIQNFFNNITPADVEGLIADNTDLDQEQVSATANVVTGIVRRASNDLGDVDLTNIGDFAQARVDSIKKALSGPQFVTRLERQGLTNAQATEVQTEINQSVDRIEKQANQALDNAEDAARKAASTAGWAWLLVAGLTLLASIFGARSAATTAVTNVAARRPN